MLPTCRYGRSVALDYISFSPGLIVLNPSLHLRHSPFITYLIYKNDIRYHICRNDISSLTYIAYHSITALDISDEDRHPFPSLA